MGELRVKGPVRPATPDAIADLNVALENGSVWDDASVGDLLTIAADGSPAWVPLTVIDGGAP